MDSQWAADILQRRVYETIGHFYVPCPLDHFHSLFYHAVVHKENFEHRETLLAMALTQSDGAVGKDFITALRMGRLELAVLAIATYMDRFQYSWPKPSDRTVFFRARNLSTVQPQMKYAASQLEMRPHYRARQG